MGNRLSASAKSFTVHPLSVMGASFLLLAGRLSFSETSYSESAMVRLLPGTPCHDRPRRHGLQQVKSNQHRMPVNLVLLGFDGKREVGVELQDVVTQFR